MIALLICFHRNLMLWWCSVCTAVMHSYNITWVSGSCVCTHILHLCVLVIQQAKEKRTLIFGPTGFSVPQSCLDWCQCVFHWSRAVWLCPWGPSAQPVGTHSCCSESEWLYCHFNDIQHVHSETKHCSWSNAVLHKTNNRLQNWTRQTLIKLNC